MKRGELVLTTVMGQRQGMWAQVQRVQCVSTLSVSTFSVRVEASASRGSVSVGGDGGLKKERV